MSFAMLHQFTRYCTRCLQQKPAAGGKMLRTVSKAARRFTCEHCLQRIKERANGNAS